MLAPSCRAVFQYLLVDSGSPAKKTKSMPTKDSESIFWMMEGSSPAVVICPAASSASSSTTSQAASGDSASASLSSLPASEAAPTMPIRYGLPAITPTPDSLPISLPHAGQSPPSIHETPNCLRGTRLAGTTPPPSPGIRQPRKHARTQVPERDDHQHPLRLPCNQRADQPHQRNQLEGMAPAGGKLLGAPEAPTANHQICREQDQYQPDQRDPWIVDG